MSAPPRVTIAIATYERAAYLEEAVASALNQTHRDLEVLIFDDGVSAAVERAAASQCARDVRVRYRRNARRLGLAANWNALGDAARGEYVAFIGDDDRLLPTFVERLLEGAPADILFCNQHLIDAAGQRLLAQSELHNRRYGRDLLTPGALPAPERAVWRNAVPSSAALIRSALVRELRFREELNTPEVELFARAAAGRARFYFVPEALAEYRTHAGSLTSAGLWSERLFPALEAIAVPLDVEPVKRRLLEPLALAAVGNLLRAGERSRAATIVSSTYYPRQEALAKLQTLCTAVPGGGAAYQLAAFARRMLRGPR